MRPGSWRYGGDLRRRGSGRRVGAVTGATAAAALLLAGCGGPASSSGAGGGATPSAGERLDVVAALYPLQYVAERVGGDAVSVTTLTSPGAEPHDLELTPQQVAAIGAADLVLYIPGFQPAVDRAVAEQAQGTAVDVTKGLTLLAGNDDEHAETAEEEAGAHSATTDPHVWLDPTNMSRIGATVADRLTGVAAGRGGAFTANQAALAADMATLDDAWQPGTRTCRSRDLVVSHEAFGYLAKRYRFEQVGISGLNPEAEPSAAKVAEVAAFVRANGVTTIYFETLVDPKVATTVAAETGAATAVLDPLEGLPEGSTDTYLSVMERNLQTVVKGQSCT